MPYIVVVRSKTTWMIVNARTGEICSKPIPKKDAAEALAWWWNVPSQYVACITEASQKQFNALADMFEQ